MVKNITLASWRCSGKANDGGQTAAARERTCFYGGHTVANGDGGQTSAASECNKY